MPQDQPRFHAPLIGRSAEIQQLEQALQGPGLRVGYVHGIGGIGKTAVLQALSDRLEDVTWHDALALPELEELAEAASRGTLVLDGLEQAPGVSETLRRQLLPRLRGDARLVLGSRRPPSVRWSADLGAGRFTAVHLEGLPAEDAQALFSQWGGQAGPQLLELCAGHPLMLVLAAQLALPEALVLDELERAPDLVVAMVEALGAVPADPKLRQAVTVCSIARRTTEPLLRTVLGIPDASGLFEQLSSFGWARRDRDGLYPHDLVRSAQRADAKWRDRAGYDRLFRVVADHMLDRTRREGEQALPDVVFLLADNPFYRGIAAHRQGLQPGPAVPTTDARLIRSFFEPHFGGAHVDRILHWMNAGFMTVFALYGPDGQVSELIPVLDETLLYRPPTGDPLVDAAQRIFARIDARPGGQVLLGYGACSRGAGLTSPLGNCRILLAALRMALPLERVTALMSVVLPVEMWRPMLERNPAITLFEEVEADGVRMLVQLQDFRVLGVVGWLEMQLYPPPLEQPMGIEMLDADEFRLAVREALKAMAARDSDGLAAGRLARTPLALRHSHPDGLVGEAVCSLLTEAIQAIPDERRRTVLERTYVDPAPKQFAAAAELGLSFGTFRRALGRGVDEVTAMLWELETRAPDALDPTG